jgi:hypothetical protein
MDRDDSKKGCCCRYRRNDRKNRLSGSPDPIGCVKAATAPPAPEAMATSHSQRTSPEMSVNRLMTISLLCKNFVSATGGSASGRRLCRWVGPRRETARAFTAKPARKTRANPMPSTSHQCCFLCGSSLGVICSLLLGRSVLVLMANDRGQQQVFCVVAYLQFGHVNDGKVTVENIEPDPEVMSTAAGRDRTRRRAERDEEQRLSN